MVSPRHFRATSGALGRTTPREASGWRHSLAMRMTLMVLSLVAVANLAGAATGWLTLRAENTTRRVDAARVKVHTAVTSLRDSYPWIAIEFDARRDVAGIRTEKPIADEASVLSTRLDPADILAGLSQRILSEVWIFRRNPRGGFVSVATSAGRMEGAAPLAVPAGTPLFDGAAAEGTQIGFLDLAGVRLQVGVVPLRNGSGEVLEVLVVGAGLEADLLRAERTLVWRSLLILLATLGATMLACGLLFTRMFRPVPALIRLTGQIADEQTERGVPYQNRPDEIGQLARAIENLRLAVAERVRLRDAQREEVRSRALRQQVLEAAIAEFRQVIASALRSTGEGGENVRSLAQHLSQSASASEKQVGDVLHASNEATGQVTAVAASAVQVAAVVVAIAEQTGEAIDLVRLSRDIGEQSRRKTADLARAAERIGSAVVMIRQIAEQTNLLALNAAIEAASAGAAGRGFAAVAAEVKALARVSARATEEIGDQVKAIQETTTTAVESTAQMEAALGKVTAISAAVGIAVEEQRLATTAIANAAATAAAQVDEIRSGMTEISAQLRGAERATHALDGISTEFRRSEDKLTAAVQDFLMTVTAA